MNLASLRAIASAAETWGVEWEHRIWYTQPELAEIHDIEDEDAAHIAAFNPQVALALIAVAEAAKDMRDELNGRGDDLAPRTERTLDKLEAALAVLDGIKGAQEGKTPSGNPTGNPSDIKLS